LSAGRASTFLLLLIPLWCGSAPVAYFLDDNLIKYRAGSGELDREPAILSEALPC
jgi:hypothetical protein